ncbi:MAG TPA: protein kinase [Thermoanaerobaculia bacterium]|nr:protein kinase [Thermoanaerobaculia bacterium]
MSLAPGARLGPYEITAKLGEGGMGEVWRARDFQLGREVALKVLPEAFTADPERAARFEREARLLAQLNHSHIAQIHGLEVQGDTRALVMELVEGPTLAERLESGALPLEESLSIARQVAEALEEAHAKGIIHRDLKPQNIKAPVEGKVKVLDFGLAKALDPAEGAAGAGHGSVAQLAASPTLTLGATVQGMILGTAAYMAPEQAKGMAIDKRADIWAFGVVLYEMISGRHPFAADSVPETLAHVLTRRIDLDALPATTPAAIRRLLRRCLERSPRERLHDIADARLVLVDALAGRDEPAGQPLPAAPASRSTGIAIAIAGAVALAVVGYAIGRRSAAAPAARAPAAGAPSFQKLTSRPGREINPALSPDGRTLYFVVEDDEGINSDIYFVPVGGKNPINLTADSPVDDWAPAVSPDGRQIAFRSERGGGGIFLMGATGESVRRLADGCFDPAWSPQGDRIACTTCPAADPFNRGCVGVLRIVEVATGASRELATGDAAAAAWSPDGRRIAYWGLSKSEAGQRDLWTVPADGGQPAELTGDPAADWNPVWSADGTAIFFLSARGGTPNLWRLGLDAASGQPQGAPASVVLPTEFAGELRRSGTRWVYVSRSLHATIEQFAFDPEGRAGEAAAKTILGTTGRLQTVAISPDSRTIAYSTVLPQQDLYVVPAEGGSPVQLTDDPALDRFPVWDPDGQRILFMSNRSGRFEIWGIRPDGSGLEQLTRTTDESRWVPRLSPDRRRLAVSSELGTSLFDASGAPPWTEFERLPNPAHAPGSPRETFEGHAWSADGTRLAGYARGASRNRVAYWSVGERTLHVFDVTGVGRAWLADQRRILVSTPEGAAILDVSNGEAKPIPGLDLAGHRGLELAADRRTLVAYRNHEEADIWLAEGIE